MTMPTITPPLPDLELCLVEGGEFMMGDDNVEYDNEKPAHQVRMDDFYIGKHPVTQELWQAVMGNNPSRFKGERRPVEQVSWIDAQDFLDRLNSRTGKKFRLPTEAEWEYAARGGKYSQDYKYAGSDRAKQVAWHDANSGDETHEVGLLLPNELGLYDMSGNVWEWCADYYAQCHQRGTVDNPQGLGIGENRVLRGGSFFSYLRSCRAVNRYYDPPRRRDADIGFRLVLPLSGKRMLNRLLP